MPNGCWYGKGDGRLDMGKNILDKGKRNSKAIKLPSKEKGIYEKGKERVYLTMKRKGYILQ